MKMEKYLWEIKWSRTENWKSDCGKAKESKTNERLFPPRGGGFFFSLFLRAQKRKKEFRAESSSRQVQVTSWVSAINSRQVRWQPKGACQRHWIRPASCVVVRTRRERRRRLVFLSLLDCCCYTSRTHAASKGKFLNFSFDPRKAKLILAERSWLWLVGAGPASHVYADEWRRKRKRRASPSDCSMSVLILDHHWRSGDRTIHDTRRHFRVGFVVVFVVCSSRN